MTTRAEQTRARLQEAALRLFQERGFDATTVADVAAAAGVSHMTFFRHFPTKEAVLLDDPYDPVIGELVAAQPPGSALARARDGLLAAWRAVPAATDEETRARVAVVAGHAGLRAKAWENNLRTEDVIVEALVATGASRLEARVAAGACLGALMAALMDWGSHGEGASLGTWVVAALEQLGGRDR